MFEKIHNKLKRKISQLLNYFKEAYDFVLGSIHSCPYGNAEG